MFACFQSEKALDGAAGASRSKTLLQCMSQPFVAVGRNADSHGLVVMDACRSIQFVNRAWFGLHGYDSHAEIISRNISFFLMPWLLPQGIASFYTHTEKVGSRFSASLSMTLIRDAAGRTAGFVSHVRDRAGCRGIPVEPGGALVPGDFFEKPARVSSSSTPWATPSWPLIKPPCCLAVTVRSFSAGMPPSLWYNFF